MEYMLFVCIYAYRYRLLRRENDDPSSPYLYVIVAAASYFIKTEMVGVNVSAVDNVVKGLCTYKKGEQKKIIVPAAGWPIINVCTMGTSRSVPTSTNFNL